MAIRIETIVNKEHKVCGICHFEKDILLRIRCDEREHCILENGLYDGIICYDEDELVIDDYFVNNVFACKRCIIKMFKHPLSPEVKKEEKIVTKITCSSMTRKGKRCRKAPLKGSDKCLTHKENKEVEMGCK